VRRGAAAVAACAVAALAAWAAALVLQDPGPAPPSPPPPPDAPPPAGPGPRAPRGRRPPPPPPPTGVDLPRAPGPPRPSAPLDEEEEAAAEEEMLAYPGGASGPVVVGRVLSPDDPDPDCWVALESAEEPARPDPSVVETLPGGRFRLTGFAPGRYRVRARADGAPAVYSREIVARDGRVADAGVLRLPRPGCIAGTVRDADGAEVEARVHLLGRDPASLVPRIVSSVNSIPRQGFAVEPHERGEFALAVEADAGWAIHRGTTGPEAVAGAEVRLRPWGAVRAGLGGKDGAAGARLSRVEVEALDAPPLGLATRRPALGLEGTVGRLPAGRYRVTVRWTPDPRDPSAARTHAAEVVVDAGRTAEVLVPR